MATDGCEGGVQVEQDLVEANYRDDLRMRTAVIEWVNGGGSSRQDTEEWQGGDKIFW